VQFDRTLIAVRERSVFDILDLALQVFRLYLWPLTITMCLGVLPLALVNYYLTNWMVQINPEGPLFEDQLLDNAIRFVWTTILLITIEAPLASVFATCHLGRAMFLEAPRIRDVVREALPYLPRAVMCHLLLRGVLPAWLLLLAADRTDEYSFPETLLVLLTLAVLVRRATAPYLNEILLLEKNPLQAADPHAMTVRRRSRVLHGSNPSSLLNQAFFVAALAVLLTLAMFGTLLCVKGVLLDDWAVSVHTFVVGASLSMWSVVGFLTVVRFLAYIDLRIRHEGWEVELRMRAEGSRLTGRLS
jgi:hypothetical protein